MTNAEFALIDAPAKEFCFRLAGSDELHRLPALGSLPLKTARRLVGLDESGTGELVDVMEGLLDRYCPGLTDSLTLEQFTELAEAWTDASGVKLGE